MTIFERLFEPLGREPAESATQDQREALMDLLVLTMYADHHLALAEQDSLDAHGERLEWTSVTSLKDFLAESIVRARDVLEGQLEMDEYLANIDRRLENREQKEAALAASQEVMAADGRLRAEEIRLLEAAKRRFAVHA